MKTYKLKVNGKEYSVDIEAINDDSAQVKCNGVDYTVEFEKTEPVKKEPVFDSKPVIPDTSTRKTFSPADAAAANVIKAPIPGLITAVLVKEGEHVKGGQVVAKMEAMKMENNILATSDGKVCRVEVKPGNTVLEGDVLVRMEEA
ncbi:MAG: biotin/lipoyl-binding protein [FCB group bacterium]|nr:biotin/lipoyl-binding protein [FCB group bacterium]